MFNYLLHIKCCDVPMYIMWKYFTGLIQLSILVVQMLRELLVQKTLNGFNFISKKLKKYKPKYHWKNLYFSATNTFNTAKAGFCAEDYSTMYKTKIVT